MKRSYSGSKNILGKKKKELETNHRETGLQNIKGLLKLCVKCQKDVDRLQTQVETNTVALGTTEYKLTKLGQKKILKKIAFITDKVNAETKRQSVQEKLLVKKLRVPIGKLLCRYGESVDQKDAGKNIVSETNASPKTRQSDASAVCFEENEFTDNTKPRTKPVERRNKNILKSPNHKGKSKVDKSTRKNKEKRKVKGGQAHDSKKKTKVQRRQQDWKKKNDKFKNKKR